VLTEAYGNKYQRKYNWKRRGLDIALATSLFTSIKDCQICGDTKGPMHIDHNHDTLKIRGVLCHKCNRAMGFFKDEAALLRRAADYLDSNN